jgi:hypothetical protein
MGPEWDHELACDGLQGRASSSRAFAPKRFRCADGTYRWLQWVSATDRDAGLIYAVARDVTDARHADAKLRRLLAEQGALRRVATLVARESEPGEVFAVVAEEIGRLLGADAAGVVRYDSEGQGEIVGTWTGEAAPPLPTASEMELDSHTAVGRVYRTGRAGRVGDIEGTKGSMARRLKQLG